MVTIDVLVLVALGLLVTAWSAWLAVRLKRWPPGDPPACPLCGHRQLGRSDGTAVCPNCDL